MIRKKPAAINRTCQACKLSKVKCDLTSSGENKCSRCERLNLQCVRVRRGNDGSARLSAPGVCALREESESSLGVLAPTCPSAIEIKMLKNLIILAQSDSSSKQVLRALLRWGSQVAWYRDDTELMAWILGKASAANCGLSLTDFAPTSKTLNAPGMPPSFVREVLCQSGLAVAFVSLDGITHWLANDAFDAHVCGRHTLQKNHGQPTCSVCAYFSPDDEIEPFESQVIAPLVVALAPSQSSDDDDDASQAPSSAGAVPANGPHDTTTSATVQRSVDLQSEVIDSTSMWRVYLRAIDSYVCCTVVFRCALQPDNALWIVGSYVPCQAPDGTWITERRGSTKCADQARDMPAELREPSQSRDQARAARIMVVDPAGSPPGSCEAAPLAPNSTEDNSELEEQLDLMSANELLNLL